MLTPPVTAVVVNYHGAIDTLAAVRSIVADAGERATVVVVDNSESAAEVERLRAGLPARAQLMVAPANLGFGRACNLAARTWPAEFTWLVNPDARILPGCLPALLQALAADPELGAVAPMQFLDPGQQWLFSPAWLPTPIGEWARTCVQAAGRERARYDRAVRAETLRLWRAAADEGRPLHQRALSGSNLLLRRACLDPAFGVFDPAFFMYFEDSDLCMRLRRQRWRMAVVPAAQALHLWHLGAYKDELMQASRPLYEARHHAGSAWVAREHRKRPQPDASQPPHEAWATWPAGPWPVPLDWQAGWSLEISPTPWFSPCIGRLGQGDPVPWPEAVRQAMPDVPLYVRLGPADADITPHCRVIR